MAALSGIGVCARVIIITTSTPVSLLGRVADFEFDFLRFLQKVGAELFVLFALKYERRITKIEIQQTNRATKKKKKRKRK
jgi:hypothetical protein